MPYIEVEELPEGAVEADVVSREEYDSLAKELGDASDQRDSLISQVTDLESSLKEEKSKFAKTFIEARSNAGAPKKADPPKDPEPPKHKTTYDSLFK